MKKNKLVDYILLIFFSFLFIYFTVTSGMNIVTYICGKNVELSPKQETFSSLDDSSWWNYKIYYNNGDKMVNDNIRLSIVETIQLRKNDGVMKFKKFNGHLTHRSAFVRSSLFLIILASILIFIVHCLLEGKREKEGMS